MPTTAIPPLRDALSADHYTDPVWVWSCDSTAHACMNKTLFKEYTPFVSTVVFWSLGGFYTLDVHGIGTVELGIRNRPNRSVKAPQNILRLVDVLHVPHLPFNVIAAKPGIRDWTGPRTNSYILDNDRNLVAYFPADPNGPIGGLGHSVRYLLDLSEPYNKPVGSAVASSERTITLSDHLSYPVKKQVISWKEVEQLRWRTYKCMNQESSAMPTHYPTETKTERVGSPTKRERSVSGNCNEVPPKSKEPNGYDGAQDFESPCKKVKFTNGVAVKLRSHSDPKLKHLRENGLKPGDAPHVNGELNGECVILSDDPSEEGEEGTSVEEMDPSHHNHDTTEDVKWINDHWGNLGTFMKALQLDVRKKSDWDKAESIMRTCVTPPVSSDSESEKKSDAELSVSGVMESPFLVSGEMEMTGACFEAPSTASKVTQKASSVSGDMNSISKTCAEMERMNGIRMNGQSSAKIRTEMALREAVQ